MRKIFSALDIGSNYIKLIVGEFYNDKLNILCAIKNKSSGFKYNQITDADKLERSINKVLKEAEEKLNFPINKIILNIPTDYNEFIVTDNELSFEENTSITSEHIIKLLQKNPKIVKTNDEMIANIPIYFKVGDIETDNPVSKIGKKISAKSVLVITDKKRVYDLIKIINNCGLEIIDITTTGLVDYYNFKNSELDKKNTIIVNIGSTSTNISVFSKGVYINNICLNIGGASIDEEIINKYNLNLKDARYLKENFALANTENAELKEIIKLIDNNGQDIIINQLEISETVNKKVSELLNSIKNNINDLTKKEISYIIITGGLAELKDLSILLKKIFKDKVRLGLINEIGARDSSYSVTIGMIKYFNWKLKLRKTEFTMVNDENIESMINSTKIKPNDENIIGKVFNYFFDN